MMDEDVIMSQKSYLIRAMYEWMLDYKYTPRLVICPLIIGVVVPETLRDRTQVTLDISPKAVTGIMLGNQHITFEAYFDKVPFDVSLPMSCIGAIIAKEKEVGYVFDIEEFMLREPDVSDVAGPANNLSAKSAIDDEKSNARLYGKTTNRVTKSSNRNKKEAVLASKRSKSSKSPSMLSFLAMKKPNSPKNTKNPRTSTRKDPRKDTRTNPRNNTRKQSSSSKNAGIFSNLRQKIKI